MAIAKKGSRSIVVDNVAYIYKVSKLKAKSDWRKEQDELDPVFMQYAAYYGLGEVKDATLNVLVQLKEQPVSNLYIKLHTVLVHGFLGPEQLVKIKPGMVRAFILRALEEGWDPATKGDHHLDIVQQKSKDNQPVILQLPNMNQGITDYKNLEKPVEIQINRNKET